MKIFIDTEFYDHGKLSLISLGAVREDGKEFYEIASDMPLRKIKKDSWLMRNVMPKVIDKCENTILERRLFTNQFVSAFCPKDKRLIATAGLNKSQMARAFSAFCGKSPEFYGYYSAYDWVCICQLFGRMTDLPIGWPMYCRDLKQMADEQGFYTSIVAQSNEHDALADAKSTLDLFKALKA